MVDAQDGVACHCDRVRAEQILWNLIANAVKFTPSGGRVDIRLDVRDRQAKITVADTGEGIRAEFLPSIFDMFSQMDSLTTSGHGGLGIGLALVQELTRAHGGDAGVAFGRSRTGRDIRGVSAAPGGRFERSQFAGGQN